MVKRRVNEQSKKSDKNMPAKEYILILHNDDVNTFEHVIDTLIRVCRHNELQAEQCALLAHLKGKCDIMSGSFEEMENTQQSLKLEGLTVTMEEL